MQPTIRPAVLADAGAIARLHVAVWRETYRELAPEAAFLALDERLRLARWTEILSAPKSGQAALVAETAGRLVGFGLAGPPGEPAFGDRGEIKFLYVDRAVKRQGIGRRLLAELGRALTNFGYRSIALGVVVGNAPAMAFYEAMGGRAVGSYRDPGPLWRSDNVIYAWDVLPLLVAG
jgi:ribosomal protein S18 acetylase RimI-like enzyme